ncbi:hypothetical protein SISNIDRAFT_487047 [Sistotremastrum niveocremeum HHB9708]|uniref:F-box domain-containing protein n=1 Tax=Sistotremastrum niveocremeum HHB9708 TaxID=1314777 RepID=A0A164SRH4_9AGAM|nr:hypothetical protein SISNIDRAFT_487047 [Sistotremastrum niveocremeum HHB9708]
MTYSQMPRTTFSGRGFPNVSELSLVCDELDSRVSDELQRVLVDPFSSGHSIRAFTAVLHELDQRLARSSQLLKQRQNMCTPIGKLSDEIILEILEYCAKEHLFGHYSPKGTNLPAPFSLCSKWRNIAVRSPTLWSNISLPMPSDLLDLFMSRNGNVPLAVVVDIVDQVVDKLLENEDFSFDSLGSSLRPVLPRISRLSLLWTSPNAENVMTLNTFIAQHIGHRELTSLEVLHINSIYTFDEPITKINAPKLLTLNFVGFVPSVPSFVDNTVTELNLSGREFELHEVLDVLAALPLLETCMIDTAEHDEPQLITDYHPPVFLPRVKKIHLASFNVDQMDYLVKHLEIPPSAFMRLDTCADPDEHLLAFEDFLGPLITLSERQCVSRAIDHYSYGGYVQSHELICKSGRQMVLTHKTHSEFIDIMRLARYAMNLSLIDLCVASLPSTAELVYVINCWSKIVHLGMRTEDADFERLLEAFETSADVPCPLLESLDCTGTSFNAGRMGQFLRFRTRQNVPLRELRFTKDLVQWTETEPEIDAFSTLVELVQSVPLQG